MAGVAGASARGRGLYRPRPLRAAGQWPLPPAPPPLAEARKAQLVLPALTSGGDDLRAKGAGGGAGRGGRQAPRPPPPRRSPPRPQPRLSPWPEKRVSGRVPAEPRGGEARKGYLDRPSSRRPFRPATGARHAEPRGEQTCSRR